MDSRAVPELGVLGVELAQGQEQTGPRQTFAPIEPRKRPASVCVSKQSDCIALLTSQRRE